MKNISTQRLSLMKNSLIALAIFLFSYSLTHSLPIGIAISLAAYLLITFSEKRAQSKKSWELLVVVPEIIDYLISGIQSGLSLNEALSGLSSRGPLLTREIFADFKARISEGHPFEQSVESLQSAFNIRAADQVFESLIFAKSLGGTELLSLLRQLGHFTRQDLSLRREIATKQGWIRNSAHLSAAAPWLLLLLLAMQPATARAFSTSFGVAVLGVGISMTVLAYLWMGKLSQLPEPRRIFGSSR